MPTLPYIPTDSFRLKEVSVIDSYPRLLRFG